MRKIALLVALLAASTPLVANPSGFVTALVAINPGTVPGAFGAQWTTTLWASNNSDADANIGCVYAGEGCTVLRAHTTVQIPAPAGLTHPGFFMNAVFIPVVQPTPPNAISFDLRVTDSVTAPHSAGTEIPLVRPNDFVPVVVIASVPLNGHSRSKLRIYGLANGSVTVRAIGDIQNREYLNTSLTLSSADTPGPMMQFPSYAEIDLPSGTAPDDTAMRVEVDGTMKVWAFVSVTDDESQQLTIVAPQPLQYVPLSLL